MKVYTVFALIAIVCILSIAATLYTVKLQDDVALYRARTEACEVAFARLRKLTPIEDKSDYPFVTNKKEIDP